MKFVKYSILLVPLGVVGLAAVVSYSLATTIAAGLLLSCVLSKIYFYIARQAATPANYPDMKNDEENIKIIGHTTPHYLAGSIALVVPLVVSSAIVLNTLNLNTFNRSHMFALARIVDYYATIKPSDFEKGLFDVNEVFTPRAADPATDPESIEMPLKQVSSTQVGLFAYEVRMYPANQTSGKITFTLPDGSIDEEILCGAGCATAHVTIYDLPAGSFLFAKNVLTVETATYFDKETISWISDRLQEPIVFSYLPKPYNYLNQLVAPFLSLKRLSDWSTGVLFVLIGLIGHMVWENIIKNRLFPEDGDGPLPKPKKAERLTKVKRH